MPDWLKVSLLLCFFGFLKEIRPSEHFVVEYLTPPWHDITLEEVNQYLWPIGTYAMLFADILVLLLTDFLRYKAVIVAGSISAIVTFVLLVWTTSFFWAVALQVTYSAYVAAEVAYFAYIYAKVDKKHYLKVTSHTRAALLCGKLVSGLLGQAIVFSQLLNLRQLTMCSLGFQIAATTWALFLPSVKTSLYFHRSVDNAVPAPIATVSMAMQHKCENGPEPQPNTNRYTNALQLMWLQITEAYSNRSVMLWSIWYAAGFCGYLQVISYAQMLWISIDNRPEMVWNGGVEACTTLLGAIVALLASRLNVNALKFQRMLCILALVSIVQGCCLCAATNTDTRMISYPSYMLFCVLHSFTITVCSAEIAQKIPDDSYGLIFGLNTAAGIFVQVLLTLFVVNGALGIEFDVVGQFNVYSGFYIGLGCMYSIVIVWTLSKCSSDNGDKVAA